MALAMTDESSTIVRSMSNGCAVQGDVADGRPFVDEDQLGPVDLITDCTCSSTAQQFRSSRGTGRSPTW